MKRTVAAASLVCGLAFALPMAATAQSNDNDYTPLNSRIKHKQAFPLEPSVRFVPADKMGKVERAQTKSMEFQFSRCLYHRSMEDARSLLDKTDFGFSDFKQIELTPDKAMRVYGFTDCLGRVAALNDTSVAMRFFPANLRQWLLRAAYLDDYPKGPTWLKQGYVIEPRKYPISQADSGVAAQMDFADCVVVANPVGADYLFRTTQDTPEEKEALQALVPSLGPCLPAGLKIQLQPATLRVWLGEALWQAANHSVPSPAPTKG